jgi:hypothetical protein
LRGARRLHLTMKLAQLGVVYVSPLGKRCMLVPHGHAGAWHYFRYLDDVRMNGDGFTFSLSNFRVMREAPRQKVPA